jgi:hypothetical protein
MSDDDEKKLRASREAFRWMDDEAPTWQDKAYLVIIGALVAGMLAMVVALVMMR